MKKLLYTKIAGFSLIEALIAALVVGVGMLGLAKMQGELFVGSSESRMRTHALNLAQDKIEEFRQVANKDLYDGFAAGANANTETIMAGSSTNFTRAWTITDNGKYKQISVTVSWTDSKGVNQNVQLTSNVAAGEPVKAGMVLASLATTSTAPTTTTTLAPTTTTTLAPTTTTLAPTTTTLAPTTTTTLAPTTTTTTLLSPPQCNISTLQSTGTLTACSSATYSFQVLGGAFKCNSSLAYANTITRFKVDGQYVVQDSQGNITYAATPPSNHSADFAPGSPINVPLVSGQTIVVESTITSNNSCVTSSQQTRASTDTTFVKALVNGDSIPGYAPLNGQPTITSYLGGYVSPDGTQISILPNQVIYLFEHYTATSGSTYDLQDNVVLVTINP